jgi:hypothetical protein
MRQDDVRLHPLCFFIRETNRRYKSPIHGHGPIVLKEGRQEMII